MTSSDARLPGFTYLAIIGLLISIGALATDIMLPAWAFWGRISASATSTTRRWW